MGKGARKDDPERGGTPPPAAQGLRAPAVTVTPPAALGFCQTCGLTYPADSRCPRGH